MAPLALLLALASATLALQEFPLNPSDVAVIRTSPSAASLPTSSPNSTCVLVPVTATSSTSSPSCTWRTYQQCRRTPRVVSGAVYSAECREEGGLQLAGCRETTLQRPLIHTVQVCRIVAEKQCMGPCFNCPTFCQPTQQGICEDSHSIRTEVEEVEEEGGRVRVERDVVTASRSCHTKQVEELCANVNCKFVRPREECTQTNSSTVALLRERRCRVCQATAAERVVVQEQCREATTNDCAGDPLDRPWKKLCSAATDVSGNSLEEGRSRQGRLGVPSLQALLSSTVGSPVEELVVAALSKIHRSDLEAAASPVVVIPTQKGLAHLLSSEEELVEAGQRLVEEEEELVKEERELVRRLGLGKEQEQPVRIDMNVKYEFLKPTTTTRSPESVYFDQLLLTQLQGIRTEEEEERREVEETNRREKEEKVRREKEENERREEEKKEREEEDRREEVRVGSTTRQPSTPLLLNRRTIELGTTSTTTTTTTTTTATSTTTTATTTSKEATTATASPRKRLSPAELLRRCFSSGIGCDFSQNEVATEDVTAAPSSSSSSSTSSATTSTTTPRPSASLASKSRLKQRVMLCFFQGICSSDDAFSSSSSTSSSSTTTTPSPRPRPSPRAPSSRVNLKELVRSREGAREKEEVRQEVRERARRCFFQGIC